MPNFQANGRMSWTTAWLLLGASTFIFLIFWKFPPVETGVELKTYLPLHITLEVFAIGVAARFAAMFTLLSLLMPHKLFFLAPCQMLRPALAWVMLPCWLGLFHGEWVGTVKLASLMLYS